MRTLFGFVVGAALASAVFAGVLSHRAIQEPRIADGVPVEKPASPPPLDPYAWHSGCVEGMYAFASDMRNGPFADEDKEIITKASDYWTGNFDGSVELLCDAVMDEERDNIRNDTGFQGEMYCRAICWSDAGHKRLKEIHMDEHGTHCMCSE